MAEKLAWEQRLAGGDGEGGAKKDYSLVKAAQGGSASCDHCSDCVEGACLTEFCVCHLFVCLFVSAAVRHRLQSRASKTLLGLGRHLRQEVQRSEVKGVTLSMLQQALRSFHISVTPEVGGSRGGCGLVGVVHVTSPWRGRTSTPYGGQWTLMLWVTSMNCVSCRVWWGR